MRRAWILPVLVAVVGLAFWLRASHDRDTAIVNWQDVEQRIDGFGGSSADFLRPLTPAQEDFFFTPVGIGLSILRTQIIPDRATCDAVFRKDACSNSNGQILNGELATAQLAVARGAKVIATPWSPPGSYKSNGSFIGGGSLLRSHYADWAKEIASYVSMMARHGVPIYAVSVQNEPDLTTAYGSCRFTPQEIHDFVPYLDSALHASGSGSTKIMIAEESHWEIDLTSLAMRDPKVAPDVGILAAHGYRGDFQDFGRSGIPVWQTEDSSQSATYDGSIEDGIGWGVTIHNYLVRAKVNAWLWWFLTDMPGQGEGTDNSALTDVGGHIPKRAYVTGQWSRFVRPGWSRIGADSSGPVDVTAFRDPTGHSFAIVAVNADRHPVTETFLLHGFATSAVTPWITSSRWSLASQTPVGVSRDTFRYTLPGSSVTTFSGTTDESPRLP